MAVVTAAACVINCKGNGYAAEAVYGEQCIAGKLCDSSDVPWCKSDGCGAAVTVGNAVNVADARVLLISQSISEVEGGEDETDDDCESHLGDRFSDEQSS